MIPEIVAGLAGISTSSAAIEALIKAIRNYRARDGGALTTLRRPEDELIDYRHVRLIERDYNVLTAFDDDGAKIVDRENRVYNLLEQFRWFTPKTESPIEASRSTKEIVSAQLTILETERNRLIPIATREHWVALVFVIIAGLVFFTSIGLVVFATLTKAIAAFIASAVPGFLSRVFFSREATIEKRLKEISSDLRESERVKERLETLEEVLKVVPEQYRGRVLEDFMKRPRKLLPGTNLVDG